MYHFIVRTFQSVGRSKQGSKQGDSPGNSLSSLSGSFGSSGSYPKVHLNRLHDTHWTTLKLAQVVQSYHNVEWAQDIVKTG